MGFVAKVADNLWLLRTCRDRATWKGFKGASQLGVGLPRPYELRLRGLERPVVYRPGSTDLLVAWELFRNDEYDVAGEWPFRVVLDGGANSGFFLAWLLRRSQGELERYVGVEADGASFGALERQALTLGVRARSTLLHAAVWKRDEDVHFDDRGPSWGRRVDATGGTRVRGLSIGSILDEAMLERCDLLKLDIEGGEKDVLESSGWSERVDAIVAELHGGLDYAWFSRTVHEHAFVPVPAGKLFRAHPGAIRRGSRFESLLLRA